MIEGFKNVGATLAMDGAAVCGAHALIKGNELLFKGVDVVCQGADWIANQNTTTNSCYTTAGTWFKNYGCDIRYASTTNARDTAVSIAKYTIAALILSEVAFRLTSNPEKVFNVGLKFFSPLRLADASIFSTLKSVEWTRPFSSV